MVLKDKIEAGISIIKDLNNPEKCGNSLIGGGIRRHLNAPKKEELNNKGEASSSASLDTEEDSEKTCGVQKPAPASEQTALIEALNHRNLIEDQIMGLIGGKMGMVELWRSIDKSAQEGDTMGFRMFTSIFPQKATLLMEYCQELIKLRKNKAGQALNQENDIVQRLTAPYQHNEICAQLIRNADALNQSGLLHRDDITEQELTQWYQNFISTGGKDDGR